MMIMMIIMIIIIIIIIIMYCNNNFIRAHCAIVGQKLSGKPGDPDYRRNLSTKKL
jgi:hypothetical protein